MKQDIEAYRPIEVYLILHRSKVEFIDMLLLVLIELLSKKVLSIEFINVRNNEHAGNITIGPNFRSYKSKPIDQLFLHPFIQNSNSVFNFQYVLIKAIEKANSKQRLIRLATKSSQLKEIMSQRILLSVFGTVRLNKNGRLLANKIEEQLAIDRERVNRLMKDAESNSIEIMNIIGNHSYLIYSLTNHMKNDLNFLNSVQHNGARDWTITYGLKIEYFKRRLQLAHVELLKMEHNLKVYEIERNGDGLE